MDKEKTIVYSYHESDNQDSRFFVSHCHLNYEFLYIVKGEIGIILEGVTYRLKCGSGLLIQPLQYHTVLRSNCPCDRLVVEFSPSFLPSEIRDDFAQAANGLSLIRGEEPYAILQKLAGYLTPLRSEDAKFIPLRDALFVELLYCLTEHDIASSQELPKVHPMLEKILELIERNLDKALTIESIAGQLFLSPSSVSHLFKRYMKISVKQYILNKKMIFASKLIKEGVPLNLVAERCGYHNYSSFYKIFTKFNESAPSALFR